MNFGVRQERILMENEKMTRSPFVEIDDDGIETICIICGEQIHAGKYPPVHDGNCRYWFDVECEFNRLRREYDGTTTRFK